MDITKSQALTILSAISRLETAFTLSADQNQRARFLDACYWEEIETAGAILDNILKGE